MNKRKTISVLLLIIGLALSVAFITKIEFPQGFELEGLFCFLDLVVAKSTDWSLPAG